MSLDFIEEVGENIQDLQLAISQLGKHELQNLEKWTFYDLTQVLHKEETFKTFMKKLLEVKTSQCRDIKEAKRVCDHWHKKCDIFVDKEFILVFIAEFQIDRMFQAKKVDEDILNTALNEMSNSPMHFEIDKVVFMMVRLHRLKELVKLL